VRESDPRRENAITITKQAKELVRDAITSARAVRDKPDHPGLFAAGAALLRLPITFRLATLSIRQGFHYENALLCRMILEQLAWIVTVRPYTDVGIFNYQPQQCIGALKQWFPSAGRLYGDLSKASHIVPKSTLRYIKFQGSRDPDITLVSWEYAQEDALALLILADMYAVVSELVFAEILPSLVHVQRLTSGLLEPIQARPGPALIAEWQKRLS
jgi:hypothetical protein